jgi:serine/threonine protein phosphatase PrpC
LKTLNKHH